MNHGCCLTVAKLERSTVWAKKSAAYLVFGIWGSKGSKRIFNEIGKLRAR